MCLFPKEAKSASSKEETPATMFIAAPVMIASLWSQPRCPLKTKKGAKRNCDSLFHTMGFYSAIKKSQIHQFQKKKWMKLKAIILSEERQTSHFSHK